MHHQEFMGQPIKTDAIYRPLSVKDCNHSGQTILKTMSGAYFFRQASDKRLENVRTIDDIQRPSPEVLRLGGEQDPGHVVGVALDHAPEATSFQKPQLEEEKVVTLEVS
ncbi:uncharacterized protein [Palaemon carinicauda]|uniref:uncharacterized protein n=1 Tax=Palaemon carinicauda TaxID=392227 RepID=UPI0035B6100C